MAKVKEHARAHVDKLEQAHAETRAQLKEFEISHDTLLHTHHNLSRAHDTLSRESSSERETHQHELRQMMQQRTTLTEKARQEAQEKKKRQEDRHQTHERRLISELRDQLSRWTDQVMVPQFTQMQSQLEHERHRVHALTREGRIKSRRHASRLEAHASRQGHHIRDLISAIEHLKTQVKDRDDQLGFLVDQLEFQQHEQLKKPWTLNHRESKQVDQLEQLVHDTQTLLRASHALVHRTGRRDMDQDHHSNHQLSKLLEENAQVTSQVNQLAQEFASLSSKSHNSRLTRVSEPSRIKSPSTYYHRSTPTTNPQAPLSYSGRVHDLYRQSSASRGRRFTTEGFDHHHHHESAACTNRHENRKVDSYHHHSSSSSSSRS